MDATIEQQNTEPTDQTSPDEADEIRGMMPSFHVWQEAQHTLKFERAAATVARERAIAAAGRKRWPLLAGLCAVIAMALLIEHSGGGGVVVPTAATPIDQLPWHSVRPPSKAFRVTVPGEYDTKKIVTAAGSGDAVEAKLQHITVTVAAFSVNGPSQAQTLLAPLFDERADALDAKLDPPKEVGSRAGLAYEATIRTTTAIATVRVIIDGAMLYLIELRGDVDTPQTKQIYDRIVVSFTAGG